MPRSGCSALHEVNTNLKKNSKVIFSKINNDIQKETSANQLKGSSSVIEWFVNNKEMKRLSFMVFDTESFYPSITEPLFNNAIPFAK